MECTGITDRRLGRVRTSVDENEGPEGLFLHI